MIEPIVEERFEYKGFPCVVLFMPMGYRCGYVGLPHGHKYYKALYDVIPVDCHGGLTYGESELHGQDDKNIYWIGFDCGHCCDGYDAEKTKEYYGDDKETMELVNVRERIGFYTSHNKHHPIRTLEYCENECKKIVDQLIDMEG